MPPSSPRYLAMRRSRPAPGHLSLALLHLGVPSPAAVAQLLPLLLSTCCRRIRFPVCPGFAWSVVSQRPPSLPTDPRPPPRSTARRQAEFLSHHTADACTPLPRTSHAAVLSVQPPVVTASRSRFLKGDPPPTGAAAGSLHVPTPIRLRPQLDLWRSAKLVPNRTRQLAQPAGILHSSSCKAAWVLGLFNSTLGERLSYFWEEEIKKASLLITGACP